MTTRRHQIDRHNKNVTEAFDAAKRGEVINLSALIGGAESIHVDDLDGKAERDEAVYSDGWRVNKVWAKTYSPDKIMPLSERQQAASAEWEAFIKVMHSGEQFECDAEMYYYWLEVLPPVFMGKTITLPNGEAVRANFGFAEGAEEITAFWHRGERYFGCRTNHVNPFA